MSGLAAHLPATLVHPPALPLSLTALSHPHPHLPAAAGLACAWVVTPLGWPPRGPFGSRVLLEVGSAGHLQGSCLAPTGSY